MQPGAATASLALAGSGATEISLFFMGLLLLAATLHNETLCALFDDWWHRVAGALGPAPLSPGLVQPRGPVSPLLHQARSIPAVLLDGVLYLGLCL